MGGERYMLRLGGYGGSRSVSMFKGFELHKQLGTASASELTNGVWWVERVFVVPVCRGSGLGTAILRALAGSVPGDLAVTPGGYGAAPWRQWGFYNRLGFVPDAWDDCGRVLRRQKV